MKVAEQIPLENLATVIADKLRPLEYITLEEALKATGLTEKTIRDHMRNTVPVIGKNAWDRAEFFDYWKKLAHERQYEAMGRSRVKEEILSNLIDL